MRKKTSDWQGGPEGFRLMHAGTGKNASDLLLALDAMELALREGVTRFVIASSDRDFSHLAQRLREYGRQVTGIGETKTPQIFRDACETFLTLPLPPVPKDAPQPPPEAGATAGAESRPAARAKSGRRADSRA
ncbi:NYN domain-containing protein [Rhodobacter capsulatus]